MVKEKRESLCSRRRSGVGDQENLEITRKAATNSAYNPQHWVGQQKPSCDLGLPTAT